jgi:hypothetical protein
MNKGENHSNLANCRQFSGIFAFFFGDEAEDAVMSESEGFRIKYNAKHLPTIPLK